MSETPAPKGPLGRIGAVIFVLWLLVVNVLYILQFRGLFLARFGSWIHRWH